MRVLPGIQRCIQKLAGMLSYPILLARPMSESFHDSGFVHMQKPALQIDAHAIT